MSEIVEFVEQVSGLYFRSVLLPKGTWIPQHAHDHDHATYCGSGKADMFVEGKFQRSVSAGQAVAIEAGKAHSFLALEDDTRLACVHDVESAESAKRR